MGDETRDALSRLLFPESSEDWEEAKAENDAAPREPGRFKIMVGGEPRPAEPWEGTCPACRRVIRSGSGGINFGDPWPCPQHEGDCLVMHLHWSEDCPAWRNRLWRFWNIRTWGRVERRWKSWKWRRAAERERADFWKAGGR